MSDTPPVIDLSSCITYAPSSGAYIDPIKLLQYLGIRAILLAESTAQPGLTNDRTNLLRGHRQEVLAFQTQLNKVIK